MLTKKEKSKNMRASPCSPPSSWSMSWTASSSCFHDCAQGRTYNILANGSAVVYTCGKPSIVAVSDVKSNALTPFDENTVPSGSAPVSACNACAMHSSGHGTLERCRCCFDGSRKSCDHVSSGMAPNSSFWFLTERPFCPLSGHPG